MKESKGFDGTLAAIARNRRNSFLDSKGIDPNPSTPLQLDLLFPTMQYDNERFIPNDCARSSLFTTRNKRVARRGMENHVVFHLHSNVSITYTGIELRAYDDELVWLQILHYGKKVPLGKPFEFTIKQLVGDLDWPTNGQYYERARKCISRLKATEIKISNDASFGSGVSNSLIENYTFDNDGDGKPNAYKVWIDRDLIFLLAGNTFTNHAWERYKKYSPITRRLADYVASHRHPNPLTVKNFSLLCDSSCQDKHKFTQMTKSACSELQDLGGAQKAWVKNGTIYFER